MARQTRMRTDHRWCGARVHRPPAIARQQSLARAEKFGYKPPGAAKATPKSKADKGDKSQRSARATPNVDKTKYFLSLSPRSGGADANDRTATATEPSESVREHAQRRRKPASTRHLSPPEAAKMPAPSAHMGGEGAQRSSGPGGEVVARLELELRQANEVRAAQAEKMKVMEKALERRVVALEGVASARVLAPSALSQASALSAPTPPSAEQGAEVAAQRVRELEAQNDALTSQNAALTDTVQGLQRECEALRSLLVGPQTTLDAQAEVAALREENARLVARLRDGAARGAGGKTTGSSGAGDVEGAPETSTAPTASDPALERELFAAAGYSVERRDYCPPDHARLLSLLTGGRVNVNARDGTGSAALAHAAWRGDEAALATLAAHGADLDAENIDGATPLHMAVYNHQPGAAALLLALGADAALALDDAKAMARREVADVFAAFESGAAHPLLAAAKAKVNGLSVSR